MSNQPRYLRISTGRHLGWWVEGRHRGGGRYLYTWWPTRRLAELVARVWAALLRRITGVDVVVTRVHS